MIGPGPCPSYLSCCLDGCTTRRVQGRRPARWSPGLRRSARTRSIAKAEVLPERLMVFVVAQLYEPDSSLDPFLRVRYFWREGGSGPMYRIVSVLRCPVFRCRTRIPRVMYRHRLHRGFSRPSTGQCAVHAYGAHTRNDGRPGAAPGSHSRPGATRRSPLEQQQDKQAVRGFPPSRSQALALFRLCLLARRDPSEGTAQVLQGLEGGLPAGAHMAPADAGHPARDVTAARLRTRFSRRAT